MIKAYITGINGVKTSYELDAEFSINEQAANNTSSDIRIFVGKSDPIPQSGDLIEIRDDEKQTTYFLGVCGIPKSPTYRSPHDVRLYSITCSNANGILGRRVANVAYQGKTVTEIIEDLFDKYIKAEGFSKGGISEIDVTLSTYTASDYNLRNCLNELAELVNGSWFCTNDRKFYFLTREDFDAFPCIIDEGFPITDLQVTEKSSDLRTNQIITGGKAKTAEQTKTFIYDGKINEFKLDYEVVEKPISIKVKIFNGPYITINESNIGINGNENADIMFYYFPGSNIISYNNGNSFCQLTKLDNVIIKYIGQYPIRVEVRNQNAISEISNKTGTSGIIDNVRSDKTIDNIENAYELGNKLLNSYCKNRTEVKAFTTLRQIEKTNLNLSNFDLLKKWRFDLPKYGLFDDSEYVLTERTLSPLVHDSKGLDMKISFKFVDRSFIKSYADTLNEINKMTEQLSVRSDDNVLVYNNFDEEVALDEKIFWFEPIQIFCTSEAQFAIDGLLLSGGLMNYLYYNG